MKSKALLYVAGGLVAVFLLTGACSAGFILGRLPLSGARQPVSLVPTGIANPIQLFQSTATPPASGTSESLQALFVPFWETWQLVHQDYIDQPVDNVAMMRGAIKGMLESLGDEHTGYMDPDQFRQANTPLVQEYEGIGAWMDSSTPYLTVISAMPGSPAEKAGLKPGDEVIAIDGKDQTGIDGKIVIKSVLGPAGTKVVLTIRRKDVPDPFDIEIVRAKINIPSVSSKMLDNGIAYVQVLQFAENTRGELRTSLKNLLAKNPKGLILDLRNNGGGYLTTAIEVASEFVNEGVIVHEVYGNGKSDDYPALGGGLATKIPIVVLVNGGTASASEIVAGAIQDYGRGTLVGETTYGKGSVQKWIELSSGQGAVRITVAHWLTPKDRQINKIGLKPDVEIKLTEDDLKANRDPQLDKAVEILNSMNK